MIRNFLLALTWSVNLLASGGCVKVTHITETGGGLTHTLQITTPAKIALTNTDHCRIAILPFMPGIGAKLDADLPLLNSYLTQSLSQVQIPPECVVMGPEEAQRLLSNAKLVAPYGQMVRDYTTTGIVDEAVMRKVAETLKADIVVQGTIVRLDVDMTMNFKEAILSFVAFDGIKGTIGWSVTVAGKDIVIDTRYTKNRDETDSTEAVLYTVGAGILGLVGVAAGGWGYVLALPAGGIPFAWGKESEIQRVKVIDFMSTSPPRLADGFARMVERGIQELLASGAEENGDSAPLPAPTAGTAPSAVPTKIAEPSSKCATVTSLGTSNCAIACMKYFEIQCPKTPPSQTDRGICLKRCKDRGQAFMSCVQDAKTPEDLKVCDEL